MRMCMYVCIFMYIFVFMLIYAHVRVCVHACMCVCTYLYVCVLTCAIVFIGQKTFLNLNLNWFGLHQALSLAHCSLSRCWRRFRVCFALVCHWGFSTLMTWCSSRTPTQQEWISKLRVNMKKVKFPVSGVGHGVRKKSGKYPCDV